MQEEKFRPNEEIVEPIVEEDAPIDVQAMLAEFDRESNTRQFDGVPMYLVKGMLVAFSLFIFYMTLVSTWGEQIRRSLFVGFIIFMAFMLYPPVKKGSKRRNYVPWYDFILAIIGSGSYLYFAFNYEAIILKATRISTLDQVIAVLGIIAIVEVCRRVVGLPILVVAGAFVAYGFYADFSVRRILYQLFYTLNGILGAPIGVASTFIVLFIILGAFLEKTNIGVFFIDMANSIAGWASGGPAKVAVIASSLEGMYSGSSVANTVGSGSITIPIMKKAGYKPEFAAAVEAAASTGGQIMPPIMGAAAFLMAELTEIPYATIALSAIIPAVLYFSGIFLMVHFEAKKLGLKGLPKAELPRFFPLMLQKGYLFLPIVVLVMAMNKYSAHLSATLAIVTAILVSMFRKDTRMTPAGFAEALENGARNTIGVAAACAIAGIIVGIVTLTGLGITLADGLLNLSGGIEIIALFLTMIACIILGMGVPTTANYVIMATITAPIIMRINPDIPLLAAHMFVFYFGIVADITPPVALAAYAGSAIANSNPMKTGVTATRLAVAAFIIPYIFVASPAILLIDTNVIEVAQIVATSLIGMFGLATGLEGFMKSTLAWWQRLAVIAGGLLLIDPGLLTDLVGFGLIGMVVLMQYAKPKKVLAA